MFRRTSLPAVFTTLVLAAVLLPGLASAHDDHDHAGQADPGRSADCTPAVMKELRSAGDRFAAGCSLPGEDIAKLDDSGAVLPPGGQASKNMSLIANIPKQGAFAGEGVVQQRHRLPGRLRLRRQLRRLLDLRHQEPEQARGRQLRSSAPARRTTSRSTATCFPRVDSSPQRRLLQQHAPQSATDQGVVGGHADLRHQRQGATRSTSSRSRPTAARTPTRWCRTRTGKATSTSTSRRTPRTRPSPTASRRTTRSRSSRSRSSDPTAAAVVSDAGRCSPTAATRRSPGCCSPTSGCHDITVYPEKDIAAGACMGDGVLFDISDRENPVVTSQVTRPELRLLALGDVQQRRHQGRLHRRARRRRRGHLQRGDRPEPRRRTRIYDIVARPSSCSRATSRSRAPGRHRELRGAQRLADPGQGQGHHGPGVVPGRRLGLGLHRLGQPREIGCFERGPLSPTSSARRHLVGVLLQRPRLLQRHPPRASTSSTYGTSPSTRRRSQDGRLQRAVPALLQRLSTPAPPGPALPGGTPQALA